MGRVALIATNWSPGYWGNAVQCAAYTKNRVPHSTLGNKIPIEEFLAREVNRGNLRPFGKRVMAHLYTEDKMEARAIEAFIIGYTETYGIYQVIDKKGKRFLSKNPKALKEEEEDTVLPLPDLPKSLKGPETPERSTTPTFGTPDGQLLVEAVQPTIPEPPRKL